MYISDRMKLKGKRALVTGSSQGIGRAIALGMAEYGADVMIHFSREATKAEAVRHEVEAFGVRCGIVGTDLSAPDAADRISQVTGEVFGGIDILVLNASVQIRRPWNEITVEEYRKQMDVNFGASLWLIQRFAPGMQQRKWGRILSIGSVQQVRPHPDMLVYSATKSAQVNMVRSLAVQLSGHGITINNLAPGAIATGRNADILADEKYLQKVLAKIPVGYCGEPYDCAGLAVLLCSDAGRYITGADFAVDGGMGLPV
jgi:glucose 1-dehydrogenase